MAEATEKEGVVSVFFGHVPSREMFDSYLKETYDEDATEIGATCPLWTDLGVDWFDHDFRETHYQDDEPVPVAAVLSNPFSYLDSYRDQLVAACDRLKIDKLNAAIFLHNFEYPSGRVFPSPYLVFVGCFPYKWSIPDWLKRLTESDEPRSSTG